MGLLDDAIREHLDLKRRRGANPTEIERAEREALGPVRRGPEVTEEDAPSAELASEPDGALHRRPPSTGTPSRTMSRLARPSHRSRTTRRPAVRTRRAPCRPGAGRRRSPVRPRGRACSPATSRRRRAGPRTRAQPCAPPGRSSADRHPRAPRPGDGGVRARASRGRRRPRERPEFLQDAPDHDRLWFEQRPPRDFDFDG